MCHIVPGPSLRASSPASPLRSTDRAKLGFEACEGHLEALAGMWQVRRRCVKEGFRASSPVWWKVLWAVGRLWRPSWG